MRSKMALTGALAFVCVFGSTSFAARRDCAQAIISEEKFAFRDINKTPAPVIAAGPTKEFAGIRYQSVAIDGHPVLYFVKTSEGVTVRWDGRASVAKLRNFVERVLTNEAHVAVVAKYSIDQKLSQTVYAGLPTLGAFYLQAANLERQSIADFGQKRHRSFGLGTPPGATPMIEAAGSVLSRQTSRGVRVKFSPEMLAKPEFREAVTSLIDQTSDAWILWPHIASALDAVAEKI